MIKLQVYISEACWTCEESQRIVADIAPQFPDVTVELLDMTSSEHPDQVFAVPTYVLNDRVIFLGNPTREELIRKLEAARQAVEA